MSFTPYLFFDATCREAFTRYQEIFGGELVVLRMGDVPDQDVPAEQADLVVHAALKIGDALLMASDHISPDEHRPAQGLNVAYTAADADDARRVFDALAEGGTVEQDLIATFFSPAFGVCTDRFGTPWMVSAPAADG